MSVTPIHVEMASVGGTSRTQITVVNDGKEPLPVETTLGRLTLNENGERTITKAGEEFLVFPPQAMIPPGGTQVFRLQWVGEPMLAQSQSYMLNVSQVPVKLPKGQSKLQVVMSFGVVINVAAQQATPSLKVVGTGFTTDKQGKRRAVVTVENPTKHHALLPDGTLEPDGRGLEPHAEPDRDAREDRHRPRAAGQAPQVRDAGRSARDREARCRPVSTTGRSVSRVPNRRAPRYAGNHFGNNRIWHSLHLH